MILLRGLVCAALVSLAKAVGEDTNVLEALLQQQQEMREQMSRMESNYEKKIVKMEDDIEERVSKLEDLAKIGTLRSCSEYAAYGLETSGAYMIDPDGGLLGQEPFQVGLLGNQSPRVPRSTATSPPELRKFFMIRRP